MESPQHRHVVVSDGARLAVSRWEGTGGPSVLLVHGLASNRATWAAVGAALHARGHTVVSYDQRGHGTSERTRAGYDLGTFLADLETVVEAEALGVPVVAGQSWGANLAIAFAARRSERVAGVVCVDGGAFDLPSRFDSWEECAVLLEPPDLRLSRDAVADRLRAAHPRWDDRAIETTLANLEERPDGTVRSRLPREAHMALLRTMWDHPPSPHHPTVEAPTLFLMALDGQRRQAAGFSPAIDDCAVEWVDGDHDLHVQLPAYVAKRIAGMARRA
jgi:pimeloyl-ACP methyl ester carboxylesterase